MNVSLQKENEVLKKPFGPKAYSVHNFKQKTINCGDVTRQKGLGWGSKLCDREQEIYWGS